MKNNNGIMEFFTLNGADAVIEKYKEFKGKEFYFDNSGIKYELSDIVKVHYNIEAFRVLFFSNNILLTVLQVGEFMELNGEKFNFYDFENIPIKI
jgi:hypothetical protein